MKNNIPPSMIKIVTILKEAGYEAYFVGGCVRDMLMQRKTHDYDITTNALPQETMQIFAAKGYQVIPTGIKHGTITVLVNKEPVEITTYRIEQTYHDHRHPSAIIFTKDLKEDLKRRDFTMNDIAYDPTYGLYDPFHGAQDIAQKRIRCVGDATTRFQEDALRMLRALRFSCVLDFTLDKACGKAIQQNHNLLHYVSKERIREEFNRLLMGEKANTLQLLYDFHVLDEILPGYSALYGHEQKTPWHIYDVFQHTDIALNHTKGYPLESKLAIIFHDWGKPACESFDDNGIAHYKKHAYVSEQIAYEQMKALKYDNKTIETVCLFIRYHDYYVHEKRSTLRRFVAHFHNDFTLAKQALDIQLADDMAKNRTKSDEKIVIIKSCQRLLSIMEKEKDMLSMKDLAINGHDLIQLGFQGKTIGDVLKAVYEWVLEEPSRNEKDILERYIKTEFLNVCEYIGDAYEN